MKGHFLTSKELESFRNYLREEEKSENTLEKYIRDVTTFSEFCDGAITKDMYSFRITNQKTLVKEKKKQSKKPQKVVKK